MSHLDISNTKPRIPHANPSQTIQPLAPDVIAHLKSSVVITSLFDVVLGLLENSLDASSSTIDISVDFVRGSCTVEDDGTGISPSAFRVDGGLGQLHHTAKKASDNVHGGNGIFLASLSSTSLLSITSKHHQHYSVNQILFHRGKTISRQTPVKSSQGIVLAHRRGTIVTVRDLFGNMPVRVKHRAEIAASSGELEKQWHSLVKAICAYCIAWTAPVSVKIQEAQNPSMKCFIRPPASVLENDMNASGTDLIRQKIKRTPSLLVSSGLMEARLISSFVPAAASTSHLSVKGLFSMVPVPVKSLQFISIGIKPLIASVSAKGFFDVMNDIFEKSAFGLSDEDDGLQTGDFAATSPSIRLRDLRKRRKGLDRWPVFFINVQRVGCDSNNCSSTESIETHALLKLLAALARGWLEQNHFMPRKTHGSHRNSNHEIQSESDDVSRTVLKDAAPTSLNVSTPLSTLLSKRPASASNLEPSKKRPRLDIPVRPSTGMFSGWSRIKSGNPLSKEQLWNENVTKDHLIRPAASLEPKSLVSRTIPSINHAKPAHSALAKGSSSVQPAEGVEHVQRLRGTELSHQDSDDDDARSDYFNAMDPKSGKPLSISKRTGTVRATERTQGQDSKALERFSSIPRDPTRQLATATTKSAGWLTWVLSMWENPSFAVQLEGTVPVADTVTGPSPEGHCCGSKRTTAQSIARSLEQTSISKSGLAHAKVISQVDGKYILVKTSSVRDVSNTKSKSTMILVDQHAASERVILESLLRQTFQPCTSDDNTTSMIGGSPSLHSLLLSKPIHFSISDSEANRLRRQVSHFTRWGIVLRVLSSKPTRTNQAAKEDANLIVTHLPPTIAERCTLEPRLLIELIREEMYVDRIDNGVISSMDVVTKGMDNGIPDWLSHLHDVPRGLLGLLNSRACRSAIMFNDRLTQEECERLIQDLAECKFPFICAHGRVSMVSLLRIEDDDLAGRGLNGFVGEPSNREQDDSGSEFIDATRQWR
ncbi:histidine kinase-like protein 14 [Elsinoe australis]|uniref:Histidine kinase-like protein 14 n=1 Tax=Elsinoe australis TaxID=40998 RepID=A0A4U7ALG3_9PEZI|nr:histidine kinase-like protein 14 [Elsinoe australis]